MAKLSKEEFAKRYEHPRWQMKRLEIMKRDGAKCTRCDASDKLLNVHHEYYVSGRNIWDYPNWSLTTLCKGCHKELHGREIEGDEESQISEWELIVGFMGGDDGKFLGRFWDMACMISQGRTAGHDNKEIASALENVAHGFVP